MRVERTTVVFWGAELVSVMKGSGVRYCSLDVFPCCFYACGCA